jgi:hypothetical protein
MNSPEWVGIAADAVFALALVLVTAIYTRATKRIATENTRLVGATLDNLYLQHVPLLVLESVSVNQLENGSWELAMEWRNVGDAPAFNASFAWRLEGTQRKSVASGVFPDMPALPTLVIEPSESPKPVCHRISKETAREIAAAPFVTLIADYQDFLGSRYLVHQGGEWEIKVDRTASDLKRMGTRDVDEWWANSWVDIPPEGKPGFRAGVRAAASIWDEEADPGPFGRPGF